MAKLALDAFGLSYADMKHSSTSSLVRLPIRPSVNPTLIT